MILIHGTRVLRVFLLSETDRIIFWGGAVILLPVTIFILIGAIFSKRLRAQPGDLILGMILSNAYLSIHWILMATFYKEADNPTFCSTIGALAVTALTTEYCYNVSFSFFLIFSLRNALTQSRIPQKLFHIFSLGVPAAYVTFLILQDGTGKTISGTCFIKDKCVNSPTNYFFVDGYRLIHHSRQFYLLVY